LLPNQRATADDLLRMTHGAGVAPAMAEALDTYFVAVIDNGSEARPVGQRRFSTYPHDNADWAARRARTAAD
jgi:hypothetical protein